MAKQAGPASAHQQAPDLTPYLGLPLRLALSTPPNTYAVGLLFSVDPSSGIVVLETGHSATAALAYPATAAAAPTQKRTDAVVAAQGGASSRRPTGFKLVKERNIKSVTVLTDSTAEAAAAAAVGSEGSSATTANGNAAGVSASADTKPSSTSTTAGQGKALPGTESIYAKALSEVIAIDTSVADRREAAATKEAQLRASRIGVGVSEEGQEVFEALSKTLPCRWHEKHIIIMDEVTLSEPYDLASLRVPKYSQQVLQKLVAGDEEQVASSELPAGEDISRARGKARSWERVGKVLEGERRKMAAKRAASGGGL
ncbi:unnamed protein product [Parajaminaea phylloscopi]